MTKDYHIERHRPGFKRVSRKEMEEQANLLLYGERRVVELAELPEELPPLRSFYRPSRKTNEYREPVLVTNFKTTLFCCQCGRRRSKFSAERCRECYRKNARAIADVRMDNVDYWLRRHQSPETAWWSDGDIPAHRKSQAWVGIKIGQEKRK